MEKTPLNPDDFVLVLSAGGRPEPLLTSIRYYQPHYAIFVASRDSSTNVTEILQHPNTIIKHQIITLSDHQNLLACTRDIRECIPVCLEAMRLGPDILLVADITGGTKVMSSALTLAMMEFNSRFTYVGGETRSNNGLGIVESGHEMIVAMDNPWDVLGLREARKLVQAFNAGHYEAALELANEIKERDEEYRTFYDGLCRIIEAFRDWDIFNYKAAKSGLEQGLGKLRAFNNRRHKNFSPLFAQLEQSFAELDQIAKEAQLLKGNFRKLAEGFGRSYLRDLLGNARRCASHVHYDDAVARLYSAVEKTAKIALAQRGVNNSCVNREFMAQTCPELAQKYAASEEDNHKLPLTSSFQLLCNLSPEDPISLAYLELETELAKTLSSRNESLLAHGYNPVQKEDYHKLHDIVLRFLSLGNDDLPDFPSLSVNSILF